jgi:hypothetical protein
MKYRQISILFFIIGLLGVVIVLLILPKESRILLNYLSVIGTFASVFGLLIAYFQILSLKNTSKSIELAVNNSTHRLNTVLSVSELAKSKKLIEEIQIMLEHDSYGASLIRLKDLKELLIQNKFNVDLQKPTNTKEYRTIIINTGIDINVVGDYVYKVKDKINKVEIIRNLEVTRTKIIEFENELKYNNHDTK